MGRSANLSITRLSNNTPPYEEKTMRRSPHLISCLAILTIVATAGCGSDKEGVRVPVPLQSAAWFEVSPSENPRYVFESNGVDYDANPIVNDNDPNTPWFEATLSQPLGIYDTALVAITDQGRIPYVSTAVGRYLLAGGGPTCLTEDSGLYRYRVEHDDEAYSVVGDLTNCIASQ